MEFQYYAVLIGLLVGGLVGLTGLGGGVLLLPLLILGLRVAPIVAVGSGAAFSALTKIGAAVVHWRQGSVDWRLALAMAVGSVPGALVGVGLVVFLRSRYGDAVNNILATWIGILLVVIPLLMVAQGRIDQPGGSRLRDRLPRWVSPYNGAVFTGLVGGFLVGLTSVGSGSVIMMLLLLFYHRPPIVLIGTDIFHAVILMTVTGLFYLGLGTVDVRLVFWLLVGSVPGVLLGTKLTAVVPAIWLRRVLMVVLLISGALMV